MQDGYGDELICYAIMPLWDMDKAGGATAIVPGSVCLAVATTPASTTATACQAWAAAR